MLDSDFNLKMIDFGYGAIFNKSQTFLGTDAYLAPEIRSQTTYSGAAVDIFNAAIILFL